MHFVYNIASLLFRFISGIFRMLVHWDLLVHWQPWTMKKRERGRVKTRNFQLVLILPEHSALTLKKWEKKRESEKEKGTGRVEEKRKILRKKENTGNCPFENIGFYLVINIKIKNAFPLVRKGILNYWSKLESGQRYRPMRHK